MKRSFFWLLVHEPDWHWPPCQSGSWKNAGKGDIEIVKVTASKLRWPGATATCPMGKKVIGGGAECSSGIGFIWLVRSIPVNNNAWYGYCDTTERIIGKITVHAICQ
ncbi:MULTISPECIES: shufflon protein B [Escherichia]|uniref:shufflon protein B n=1 Tax=Escherichia TaxID=561 RepID=UPI00203A3B9C|nr:MULTISPECIES: shufflon protein B [Escherichia]